MAKFRRGTITSPATTGVVNVDFARSHKFDRRSSDASFNQNPLKTAHGGSGSFELTGNTFTDIYNGTLVIVVEDVSAASGVETVTSRTFTFSEVTTNQGANANNDGGEGSRKVSFDFTDFVES
jgi:hypothetical protein